jgi:ribosomal protein S18 acetylase RimI-like enzyme
MRQMEQRLRQIAAEQTIPLPSEFEVWSSDTQTHLSHLLDEAGYQVVRFGLDMVRPHLEHIPHCPVPPGIEIRPGTLDEWPQIWLAAREAFRDHWGYVEWPESHREEEEGRSTFYPPLWQVAWVGDKVAGGVLNFIDRLENETYGRKRGYTETIFVRRPWRGQGLAKALIAQSLAMLKGAGMDEAGLSVDAENLSGALHLYHKMGFQEVKRFIRYRKPLEA